MEIEKFSQQARDWISKSDSNSKIDLFLVDNAQNRLNFQVKNQDVTFYVVVPSDEQQPWHVWSDVESICEKLAPTIEHVTGGRYNTLEQILDSCHNCIFKAEETGRQLSEENGQDDDEDEEEDFDNYYEDDEDIMGDVQPEAAKKDDSDLSDEDSASFFGPMSTATGAAIQRLRKDLKNIMKVGKSYGIIASPRGNNLFVWDVVLTDIPTDSTLGKDLQKYSSKYNQEPVLKLEMQFPQEYPFSPPFIRVIKPRFKFLTGHVTIGGSICMEMLTKSGWVPSNDIESILVQVRAEIMSDANASLDVSRPNTDYTEQEARDAFNRMVQRYGWNK